MMLEILYQDEWLVAVNKPSGWLVHRSWLDRDEKVVVMQTVRDQIGQHVFTAHRLDRPTSGVLLMGLSSEAGVCWRSSLNSIRSRSATTRSCAAG
jgi:tRNA pseudouridine65 synthase